MVPKYTTEVFCVDQHFGAYRPDPIVSLDEDWDSNSILITF